MPEFYVSWTQVDTQNGRTSKYFEGEFADEPTGLAAANALLTAWDAATNSAFENVRFGQKLAFTGTQATGTVFQRATYNVNVNGGGKASFDIPDPITGLFVAGSNAANLAATQYANITSAFNGADSWRISDGEQITGTNTGARTYARSGRRNLK